MKSNSPMMHRVARHHSSQFLPFSIPRKGRIRIVLVLALIIIGIRIIPGLFTSVHLPQLKLPHISFKKNQDSPPTRPQRIKKTVISGKREQLLSRSITKITKDPSKLAAVMALPISGKDSVEVYTSIDTTLKDYIEKLFNRYHPLYGALVALHPSTGRILALSTYTNDSMPDLGANLCCRSFFPAASTFKTVTAAAAIEYESFEPSCLLEHRGRTSTLYRSQIKQDLDWSIDISFAQAYARSVNAVFARIGMYEVGRNHLAATTDAFGFNMPVPGDLFCEPSVAVCPDSSDSLFALAEFASGFNQRTLISPLHGACIAAAISGNGTMPVPTLIDSIVQVSNGETKYMALPAPWQQAVTPSTAATLRSLMHSVVSYGTARKQFRDIRNTSRFDDFLYGGKTGSVDKDGIGRVDWFIGFAVNPELSDERIAVAALTVHGAYWTVHSSYLAAEAMRFYLRRLQKSKETLLAHESDVSTDSATAATGQ